MLFTSQARPGHNVTLRAAVVCVISSGPQAFAKFARRGIQGSQSRKLQYLSSVLHQYQKRNVVSVHLGMRSHPRIPYKNDERPVEDDSESDICLNWALQCATYEGGERGLCHLPPTKTSMNHVTRCAVGPAPGSSDNCETAVQTCALCCQ